MLKVLSYKSRNDILFCGENNKWDRLVVRQAGRVLNFFKICPQISGHLSNLCTYYRYEGVFDYLCAKLFILL